MNPELVMIRITWPDGDNSPRDCVAVELVFEHKSLILPLRAWGSIELRAVARMSIVN
jgi:hypothetical protein